MHIELSGQSDCGQRIPDAGLFGVETLQFHEAAAGIRQPRCGMKGHIPLNQGWQEAGTRQVTVGWNRNAPAIVTALHGYDFTQVFDTRRRIASNIVAARHPMYQARAICRQQIGSIEPEPARPGRRWRLRIDGDQFKVKVVAQTQQAVVRTHAGMLAAISQLDPEALFEPSGTEGEIARSQNEVIRCRQD
jgi:hypothetical protein